MPDQDEWGADDSDWEDESLEELEDLEESADDEEPCISCPNCQKQIHEDSQRCPYCETYIWAEDVGTSRKPWLIVGVVLCLYVVYRWIVG